ncbi:MAG: hypothetical protein Kow0059_19580 [Candidatus Sumerlaeia bacterium]
MTPSAWFITATGTGVGKTLAAGAFAIALQRRGLSVCYYKPAETGVSSGVEGDADLIARITRQPPALTRGAALRLPLAPAVAAECEHSSINWNMLDEGFRRVEAERPDVLIVEGAGGLAVPLCPDDTAPHGWLTFADAARRWRLPLLIVADAALGTINHTVLTISYAHQSRLDVAGLIINNYHWAIPPQALLHPAAAPDARGDIEGGGPPACLLGLNRLADRPVQPAELRTLLRSVPASLAGDAAFTNPAVISTIAQTPVLAIVPRLKAPDFPSLAAQAAPYMDVMVEKLIG